MCFFAKLLELLEGCVFCFLALQRRSQELGQGGGGRQNIQSVATARSVAKIFEGLPPPQIDNKWDYWGRVILIQYLVLN